MDIPSYLLGKKSGGSAYDWRAIGYDEEPTAIKNYEQNAYNIAVDMKKVFDEKASLGTRTISIERLLDDNFYREEIITIPEYDWNTILSDTTNNKKSRFTGAFRYCYNLIYVPKSLLYNDGTASNTTLDAMFSYCHNLKTIDVSDLIKSNVINTSSMFNSTNTLEYINGLDKADTSNVTNMNTMFSGSGVFELDLSSFDTSKVTTFSGFFSNCKRLEQVTFSQNFNTANSTGMNAMFSQCRKLKRLDLTSFDTKKVTTFNQMFYYCTSLEHIDFGENFQLIAVPNTSSPLKDMFYANANLDDSTLNAILHICTTAPSTISSTYKKLSYIGFSSSQYPASRIQALSNYQEFIDAGWIIGY